MNVFNRALRRWSPKRYCRWMLARAKRERREKLKAARELPAVEQRNLAAKLDWDMWGWQDWLQEIEESELVNRARKMDVYLDDIPLPPADDEDSERQDPNSHYRMGSSGNTLLHPDSRAALIKKVRERYPLYRKEQREIWELWMKAAALLIGVLGAASALVALLKK
jgi:hypothetical protein